MSIVVLISGRGSNMQALLDAAVAEGGFAAIFLLDDQGRVAQATLANGSPHVRPNLLGADFSRNPLFASARHLGRRVWSDRYLSARNGEGAVGLAIPIKGYVLLGEVAPDFLRAAIERSTEDIAYPVMVVDGAGEYVAGRNLAESDRLRNWAVELRAESVAPGGDVRELVFGGTSYDAGIARAEKLDWTFMVANPAGWANPRVRVTVLLVVAGFVASLLLALSVIPPCPLPPSDLGASASCTESPFAWRCQPTRPAAMQATTPQYGIVYSRRPVARPSSPQKPTTMTPRMSMTF